MAVTPKDIKAMRARTGWSQYDLADRIGCNQSTVCRMENGEKVGKVIEKVVERLIAEHPPERVPA